MITEAFLSGDYRKWERHVKVGVPKYMQRIRIKGISKAMADRAFKSAELFVNGFPFTLWRAEKDRLYFDIKWPKGNYRIQIKINYTDLEPAVYKRS